MSGCAVSGGSARRRAAAISGGRRLLVAAGALVLAGGGLGACSSGAPRSAAPGTTSGGAAASRAGVPGTGGATAVLTSAARGAGGLRSVAFDASVEVSGLPPSADHGMTSLTIAASGEVDAVSGLAEATITSSASPTALALVVDRASGLVYLELPPALRERLATAAGTPVRTPWVALPLSAGPSVSSPLAAAGNLGDLRMVLRGIDESAVQVVDAGPSVVDGAPVTRLLVRLDLGRLLEVLVAAGPHGLAGTPSTGSSSAALAGALAALLGHALAGTTVTVQVMVDRSEQLRRIEGSIPLGRILASLASSLRTMFGGSSAASGLGGASPGAPTLSGLGRLVVDFSVTLSRFDAAVSVSVPSASEVTVLHDPAALSQAGALGSLASLGSLGV